jgi:uncharacterized protein YqgV (UPF0045/DUF77 family)
MGVDSASVSPYIAKVQTLLKESGLEYHMHANGTTVGKRFWLACAYREELNADQKTIQRVVGTPVIMFQDS